DLEPLAPRRAEAAGRLIGLAAEADEGDDLARLLPRIVAVGMAQEGADHDVLEDGHLLEGRRHLEGTADAETRMRLGRGVGDVDLGEDDAPARRHQIADETVEEGRLAGPVGTDEADDL